MVFCVDDRPPSLNLSWCNSVGNIELLCFDEIVASGISRVNVTNTQASNRRAPQNDTMDNLSTNLTDARICSTVFTSSAILMLATQRENEFHIQDKSNDLSMPPLPTTLFVLLFIKYLSYLFYQLNN